MPETFDPLWEYYSPDPAILELSKGPNVRFKHPLALMDFAFDDAPVPNHGFRYGSIPKKRRRPIDPIRCETCKTVFTPYHRTARYCGHTCWANRPPIKTVACLHCGKIKASQYSQKLYCSSRCRETAAASNTRYPPIVCPYPGCPRKGTPFAPAFPKVRFCSRRCVALHSHHSRRTARSY